MSEQEVQQIEFEKFKRELIVSIQQMTINDHVTLVIEYGTPIQCDECGRVHKGTRCLDNCSPNVTMQVADMLVKKAAEQVLGIANNKWGRPKEN